MTENQPKKIAYTVQEVASRLSVCKATIYRGVADGSILSRRVGAKILIPAAWIDNFFETEQEG